MKNTKQVIEDALIMGEKWNILTLILMFPLFIGMVIFVGYYVVSLGQLASKGGETFATNLTELESLLAFPTASWGWIFLISWLFFIFVYYRAKRNKIQACFYNNILIMAMILPSYYSVFYGTLFFVSSLFIRITYWSLFVGSLGYLVKSLFLKNQSKCFPISSESTKHFKNIILLLWLLNIFIRLFTNGFSSFFAKVLLAILPIIPLIVLMLFTTMYRAMASTMRVLYNINKNQEHYRKEFGYSIEDWYGKKSKQYKESLGK
ncbi:TPA: hypothetical protein ACGO1F_001124 [Streptococcus suis]|uniref:hypothetical protein n=1 Tax=Streptococcus suis TaxID=1307 RepID=UPI000CF63EA2|nr:hypothetical protein [Streptococcus suis]